MAAAVGVAVASSQSAAPPRSDSFDEGMHSPAHSVEPLDAVRVKGMAAERDIHAVRSATRFPGARPVGRDRERHAVAGRTAEYGDH